MENHNIISKVLSDLLEGIFSLVLNCNNICSISTSLKLTPIIFVVADKCI